ncbi:MAG: hypothetical protein QT10_C0017G0005 [archaeon GW2011_AR19]|nr:MAG: hypothetical protein QT10_C0017G0005 [archaeon GW2011_AR19]
MIKNKKVKHILRKGIKEISHYVFFPKNRIGAEKIISVYWFVILIIIAGAVVAMVSLFYGSPYDVRVTEANIMINQVSNCLSQSGELNKNLFISENSEKKFNENFNLLEECNLIFETKFENAVGEYFLEAEFYDLNNERLFSISEGNSNLKTDCKIAEGEKKYKRLSKCVDREFYSLDSENQAYKINILSVVRKTEKNVK